MRRGRNVASGPMVMMPPPVSAPTGRISARRGVTEIAASTSPANARTASMMPSRGGSLAPWSNMSASDPATMSPPAIRRSDDSRRGSTPAGATKRTKNAVPRPRAMPAYDRARPTISSVVGGGADPPMSGTAGSGPLPTTNAKLPFVVCPSTALLAVQATRYPPSVIGSTETRRPLGSPDAPTSPLS